MQPAYQRFGAAYMSALQIKLCLVEKHEFLLFQRLLQAGFDIFSLGIVRAHFLDIEPVGVPA